MDKEENKQSPKKRELLTSKRKIEKGKVLLLEKKDK